jgi:hypothetical protein
MLDSEIGTSALRLWMAAGSAALLVACCGLTFVLPTTRTAEVARAVLVAFGAVLGGAVTWASLGGSSTATAERHALEQRAAELTVRTLAPGSPLACLDALAGESVEVACEKAIFASPASVAAATSYVAARLALLSDIGAYARRGGAAIDGSIPLQHALEIDRFGFLAHVLATRDSCTGENCKALALLRDPTHVRANLSEQTFNHYLERYLLIWAKAAAEPPVAEAPQAQTAAPVAAQATPPGPHKVVNIDFPSAASIPAVNIMNPEPSGPVLPGVAAAAAANPNGQSGASASSRHSRKATANPPAPAARQSAGSGAQAAVEPIWPEPLPPQPSGTAANGATPAPPIPSAPAPTSDPNAAAPARTQ